MTNKEILPGQIPISLAAPTSDGSKLDAYQQAALIAHVRRLNLDPLRQHLIADGYADRSLTSDVVLGIAHRMRLSIRICTPAEKVESETYLRQRGLM